MVTPTPPPFALPRYERPREEAVAALPAQDVISFQQSAEVIAASTLSPGSQDLLRGLLRVGTARSFPGGGAGIEYGSLLKTAARPDYLGAHIREAADHLREQQTDLLLVPGMSGYPVGSMYALAAQVPALLLKKTRLDLDQLNPHDYPAGAFIIPSYTGEGDVIMHADPASVTDIVATIVRRKLAAQSDANSVELELRVAGADDIIDKATMSQAIGESALVVGEAALRQAVARHRARTGDDRPIITNVRIVAWVTPLIKGYNHPYELLWNAFRLRPFAGVDVSAVYREPPAIGIAGIGTFAFASDDERDNHD